MSSIRKNKYVRAVGLGVMAGMRSMSGPWLMSYRARREPESFRGTRLGWLSYRPILVLTSLMGVGELIADKTPYLPRRIAPGPLVGRAQLGAFAGAAAFTEEDASPLVGALAAAAGAVASSFVFYYLRRGLGQKTGLPDPFVALLEDAALAGIGLAVLKTYE